MAKKPKSPPPVQPGIVSTVAADRFIDAQSQASSRASARDWLRAFLDGLAAPAQPSAAEARAAVHTAGLARMDLDPSDERLRAILAPDVVLTPAWIASMTDLPADSARAAAQALRDEGRLEFVGRGQYRVPAADVFWPSTDRNEGWVITREGKLYAL